MIAAAIAALVPVLAADGVTAATVVAPEPKLALST
jgi:hypothetical protein